MLRYSKKVNGTYYVVEAIPESRYKKFWVVSAYMKETDGFTQARNAQSPASTPEASLASQPSANDSIAQDSGSVNTDAGLIYETLVDMGVHKAAESLAKQYSPADGVSAEVYARGNGEAYLYGNVNLSVDEMSRRGTLSADLAEHQRTSAYKMGQSVSDLIRAQQTKAKENGRTLSWMQPYEEMVADSMETMLADGKVMEMLAVLKTKDKSLVQKIKDWFREFAAKIKRAYETAAPDTREGQLVAEMVDEIDRIQELFAEGLAEASKNYKALGRQKNNASEGDVMYSFRGYAEDGRGMYESNFPKGTPKKAKSERILQYIQNVWSKKPIALKIKDATGERVIQAKFDPTYDETGNTPTDASKLMGGNRHGTSAEQRVTLDLADDYYKIASEAKYNYSKNEIGKTTGPHIDVKQWHYFVNNIYFAEHGNDLYKPYRVSINIKEKMDGEFVYSFSAEKEESSSQRTLHAVVNSGDTTAKGKLSNNKIAQKEKTVKGNDTEILSDRGNISTRSIMTELDASEIKNEIEWKHLLEYQENSGKQLAQQKKLQQLQAELKDLESVQGKKDVRRIRFLKDEKIKTENRINIYEGKLRREEYGTYLKGLIQREENSLQLNSAAKRHISQTRFGVS